MSFFNWLTGHFSKRGRALSRCKRGVRKARNRDHEGAINDYTTTIGMPNVPADVKAMALYNRALVHFATGDDAKCVDDLDAVLAMDGAMVIVNVRTMAKQKMAKMESRTRPSNE